MKKIWIDAPREMNREYAFYAKLRRTEGEAQINICCSNLFQVYLNGKLFYAGTMRSAHGYSFLVTLNLPETEEETHLLVLVNEYAVNSYDIVDEPAFFSCEVRRGDVLLADSGDFKAYAFFEREQKVERMCLQRNFVESYFYTPDTQNLFFGKSVRLALPVKETQGNDILPLELTLPKLQVMSPASVTEEGELYRKETYYTYVAPPSGTIGVCCKGYAYDELTSRISLEISKIGCRPAPVGETLSGNYRLYDMGVNKSGFIRCRISVEERTTLYFAFDEILYPEVVENAELRDCYPEKNPLVFHRLYMVNAVKYILDKGEYELTTLEPYTFRYLKAIVASGRAKILFLGQILYENPDGYNCILECGDERLKRVFDAAQNTFAQNAVDVLTDCPSRERAGWLCDSFFTGRAEKLLTGDNKVERNFLLSYARMKPLPDLPEAMLPMCYPADHLNRNYIPNWAMWFVIELEDYYLRTGDGNLVDELREKVENLIEFFLSRYRNEDGLLEKLDKWVFVEWSKANEFIQDVNYPTNMLFTGCLEAAFRLYGTERYKRLAEEMKETIIGQSFNGEFFEDNRIRRAGKLERTRQVTETCQYYAFFFGVASKERFPELYRTVFRYFGAHRDCARVYPQVYKSNAFIGNFLRLELIRRDGRLKELVGESIEYFEYMAKRTGTLWEYDAPTASCNHGFASYVACMIAEGLTGYVGTDKNHKPVFRDEYFGENCEMILPVYGARYKITVKDGLRTIEILTSENKISKFELHVEKKRG